MDIGVLHLQEELAQAQMVVLQRHQKLLRGFSWCLLRRPGVTACHRFNLLNRLPTPPAAP